MDGKIPIDFKCLVCKTGEMVPYQIEGKVIIDFFVMPSDEGQPAGKVPLSGLQSMRPKVYYCKVCGNVQTFFEGAPNI